MGALVLGQAGCIIPCLAGGAVPVYSAKDQERPKRPVPAGRVVLLRFYEYEAPPDPMVVDHDGQLAQFPAYLTYCTDLEWTMLQCYLPVSRWHRSSRCYSVMAFAPGCWPTATERCSGKDNRGNPSKWNACDTPPLLSEGTINLYFPLRTREYGDGTGAQIVKDIQVRYANHLERLSADRLTGLSREDKRMVIGELLDLLEQDVGGQMHGGNVAEVRRILLFFRGEAKKLGLPVAEDDASALAMAKSQLAKKGLEATSAHFLRLAAFEGWSGTLEFLLSCGASPNYLTEVQGCTPLKIAISAHRREAAAVLLKHGAAPNAPDKSGESNLHCAAAYGDAEIARLLLEHGAKVNAGTHSSWTPLMEAAMRKDLAVARVLLEHGANPNMVPEIGLLPLEFAVEDRQIEMVKLLLKYGADPLLRNWVGSRPVDSVGKDDFELRKLLQIDAATSTAAFPAR
jgi:hypothetical protein